MDPIVKVKVLSAALPLRVFLSSLLFVLNRLAGECG